MGNFTVDLSNWVVSGDGKVRGAYKTGISFTGSITFAGLEQSGQTLTAVDTLTSAAGLGTFSYVWLRDNTVIVGEASSSYLVTDTDVATTISCTISGIDGWSNPWTSTGVTSSKVISAGARTLWVTTAGNDTNNGLSELAAFATWDMAASVVLAGDTVQGTTGTYLETGAISNPLQNNNFYNLAKLGVDSPSVGTALNPITYRAALGHEGAVIIDFAHNYVGFRIKEYQEFYDLQFHRALASAIDGRGDQAGVRVSDPLKYLKGVKIVNNYFYYTRYTSDGTNVSSIRLDYNKDCVITGNKIRRVWSDTNEDLVWARVGHASGIQCYDAYNLLIENNEISDTGSGILLKNHSLLVDDVLLANRVYHAGTEVRYNTFFEVDVALQIIPTGDYGTESSNNNFHHNLGYDIYNFGVLVNASNTGVAPNSYNSQNLNIDQNIFISKSGQTNNYGLNIDSTDNISVVGNIFSDFTTNWTTKIEIGTFNNVPTLTASDFNVYDQSSFRQVLDFSGTEQVVYTTLISLQAALISDATLSLAVDNPDTSSIEATSAALYTDKANLDFTHAVGSPAIDLLGAGLSAGCYNLGNETIGTTEPWVQAI